MDRVELIMAELTKCNPAHFKDGGIVGAVYLPSESIGVITCQAIALRKEVQKLQAEVERLKDNQ